MYMSETVINLDVNESLAWHPEFGSTVGQFGQEKEFVKIINMKITHLQRNFFARLSDYSPT